MYTKLLRDLDEQIRNSADRVEWARIVCRKASYFARQGETSLALQAIDRVRTEFAGRIEPEVACWLMLAEGILHYFQVQPSEAYDRFRGAYGLAKSFGASRALPACAAWMAHIELDGCGYDSMIKFLEEALANASPDDHPTQGRASLVLADALHLSGQYPKARTWYEKTRRHATSEEDRSMLSALFHNVAAFRIAHVRLADACGETNAAEAQRASMELYSSHNYDVGVGVTSFQHSIPLLQAQMLSVEGRHYEALVILTSTDLSRLQARFHTIVDINKAWCSLSLDLRPQALAFARSAVDRMTEDIEIDDHAYVLARLLQIEKALGETILESCAERAAEALGRHRQGQAALMMKLDQLLATLGKQ